jgi:hypothetical protein
VRWAAIEACQRTRQATKLAADRARIIAHRGYNIGVIATRPQAAHPTSTTALRDGQIRTLAKG